MPDSLSVSDSRGSGALSASYIREMNATEV